jgi:hypothetical protein
VVALCVFVDTKSMVSYVHLQTILNALTMEFLLTMPSKPSLLLRTNPLLTVVLVVITKILWLKTVLVFCAKMLGLML